MAPSAAAAAAAA